MTAPKCITIFSLSELNSDWMREAQTEAEAERLAIANGQDAYYLFPPNHTYYVYVEQVTR